VILKYALMLKPMSARSRSLALQLCADCEEIVVSRCTSSLFVLMMKQQHAMKTSFAEIRFIGSPGKEQHTQKKKNKKIKGNDVTPTAS
jgi:hypothetical protein